MSTVVLPVLLEELGGATVLPITVRLKTLTHKENNPVGIQTGTASFEAIVDLQTRLLSGVRKDLPRECVQYWHDNTQLLHQRLDALLRNTPEGLIQDQLLREVMGLIAAETRVFNASTYIGQHYETTPSFRSLVRDANIVERAVVQKKVRALLLLRDAAQSEVGHKGLLLELGEQGIIALWHGLDFLRQLAELQLSSGQATRFCIRINEQLVVVIALYINDHWKLDAQEQERERWLARTTILSY